MRSRPSARPPKTSTPPKMGSRRRDPFQCITIKKMINKLNRRPPKEKAQPPVNQSQSRLSNEPLAILVTSPIAQRTERKVQKREPPTIEYAPPKEKELPWIPDTEFDLSLFGGEADLDLYEQSALVLKDDTGETFRTTQRKFELDSIKEEEITTTETRESPEIEPKPVEPSLLKEEPVLEQGSPVTAFAFESVDMPTIVTPTAIEYGPPREKEPEFFAFDDVDVPTIHAVNAIDDDALEFVYPFEEESSLHCGDVSDEDLAIPFSDFVFDDIYALPCFT
ncbi:uncharacterized protein BYT42DRAFT_203003 [Radiomyces spectabilis]|uniref:uncharacterized protein n=1 Tax=Radiomyces spectabilis TaxID=64574 RepID=UPI00221E5534|nr:uncharacterized protein BYT42DRAFT_203003 [Radiomyces spectabilis]KAI8391654.1 hypothetical protein BYT42DRAFT_203003 [Radiomyces spectabilis]